jgi:rSAM/selenodomain-associated transferase 1
MLEAKAARALGVFAKRPGPGEVKTRLAAAASADWASEVHAAFLLDLLDRLDRVELRRWLAYTPAEARPYFERIAQDWWELVPQVAGDLGRRMAAFFQHSFDAGSIATVLVGIDSPTLPLGLIHLAFAELDRADLVLGPCTDGGYYLVGCTPPVPDVFTGIDWGTSRVLEQTIARLREHPRRPALLPPWYDVDTIDDWQTLRGHVAALRLTGVDPQIPRTEALLNAREPAPRAGSSRPDGR